MAFDSRLRGSEVVVFGASVRSGIVIRAVVKGRPAKRAASGRILRFPERDSPPKIWDFERGARASVPILDRVKQIAIHAVYWDLSTALKCFVWRYLFHLFLLPIQ